MRDDAIDGAEALAALRAGGKAAMARALALIERAPRAPKTCALLDAAWSDPKGVSIGVTGPPGVGKSSLIDALIRTERAESRRVGVVAVDPSSQRSGGALLGDRTRFATDPTDDGVFVRSMAARSRLGGLADLAYPAATLMRACYDLVVIETVGVGQSETDVASTADATVFCIQPGSGDAIQFMKAGVMEIPDLVLVTKADMGPIARRAQADAAAALSLGATSAPPPVRLISAQSGEGVAESAAEMRALARAKTGPVSNGETTDGRQRAQAAAWAERSVVDAFGGTGLRAAAALLAGEPPFQRWAGAMAALERAFAAGLRDLTEARGPEAPHSG